jgi:PIN domain-containing protein
MGDPKGRSRKRSSGKQVKSRPLKNFTLYLDESFNCEEVKVALSRANIKFRVYTEDFKGGAEDPNILPLVGKRGWAMLTCDSKNRYRGVEHESILRFRVRLFVFSGNLGGATLAELLVRVYQKMRTFSREHSRPFVAVTTKSGDIYLRMDHRGNVSGAK